MEVSDLAFAKFLGREVRRAREARGWTRGQLVERMPSGIGDRTLLSYEHGIRFIAVVRLVEICRALGVAASEILRRAEVAAESLVQHTLVVNLRAVQADGRDGYAAVADWARRRAGGSGTVRLEPATVREMAAMLGFEHRVLAAYLAEFSVDE